MKVGIYVYGVYQLCTLYSVLYSVLQVLMYTVEFVWLCCHSWLGNGPAS